MVTLRAIDEVALEKLAGEMAAVFRAMRPADRARVIYLVGELGAGKTTWARGFLRGLGVQGRIRSPTFTLMEPYSTELGSVCHFDLYRIIDPEEVEYLGIRDLDADAACLMFEWPERAEGAIPAPDLTITLSYLDVGRQLDLCGPGASAYQRLG